MGHFLWAFIVAFDVLFGAGVLCGAAIQKKDCSDAAISDAPPAWWRKALIHARARKEAEKEAE